MKQLQTMAVLALGMTFGLACGDAARMLLPPDAGAQDGGADAGVVERPKPRVIEGECGHRDPVTGTLFVKVGFDELSLEEMMAARVWNCGRVGSGPGGGPRPSSSCTEATFFIEADGIASPCGGMIDAVDFRPIYSRVVIP